MNIKMQMYQRKFGKAFFFSRSIFFPLDKSYKEVTVSMIITKMINKIVIIIANNMYWVQT